MSTLAILQPRRDKPQPEHQWCLENRISGFDKVTLITEVGKGVIEARNALAQYARKLQPRPDFVLMLDDDSYWCEDLIPGFVRELENLPALSLLVGVCGPCKDNAPTLVYRGSNISTRLRVPEDVPRPGSVEVWCAGSHFWMMRPELLDAVGDNPFDLYAIHRLAHVDPDPLADLIGLLDVGRSEDFSFCRRVHDAGGKVFAYTSDFVGHVAENHLFVPGRTAYAFLNGDPSLPYPVRHTGGTLDLVHGDANYGFGLSDVQVKWQRRFLQAIQKVFDEALVDRAIEALADERLRMLDGPYLAQLFRAHRFASYARSAK